MTEQPEPFSDRAREELRAQRASISRLAAQLSSSQLLVERADLRAYRLSEQMRTARHSTPSAPLPTPNGDRVADGAASSRVVEGDRSQLAGASRVVVLASYSADSTVSRSLAELVAQCEREGYRVVLIRASESEDLISWPTGTPRPTLIVQRPNLGYDFGSWASALALFPEIATVDKVILANDSLIGPFASIQPMLIDFENAPGEVWGAVSSGQGGFHLQSFFLGFRGGILNDEALATFWRDIRVLPSKDDIVEHYERGLSVLLAAHGYAIVPFVDHALVGNDDINPTMSGWHALLEQGFPFVKRILINNAQYFPEGDDIAAAVRSRFGTDLREWL